MSDWLWVASTKGKSHRENKLTCTPHHLGSCSSSFYGASPFLALFVQTRSYIEHALSSLLSWSATITFRYKIRKLHLYFFSRKENRQHPTFGWQPGILKMHQKIKENGVHYEFWWNTEKRTWDKSEVYEMLLNHDIYLQKCKILTLAYLSRVSTRNRNWNDVVFPQQLHF